MDCFRSTSEGESRERKEGGRVILGFYRDNGKQNGNYYSIIGYILWLKDQNSKVPSQGSLQRHLDPSCTSAKKSNPRRRRAALAFAGFPWLTARSCHGVDLRWLSRVGECSSHGFSAQDSPDLLGTDPQRCSLVTSLSWLLFCCGSWSGQLPMHRRPGPCGQHSPAAMNWLPGLVTTRSRSMMQRKPVEMAGKKLGCCEGT